MEMKRHAELVGRSVLERVVNTKAPKNPTSPCPTPPQHTPESRQYSAHGVDDDFLLFATVGTLAAVCSMF